MRAFRIFVDGIELDYVREDLKVREENNSFSRQLKVSYTTRPIRIVENREAVEALGEFSIPSARKKKFFSCKIVKGGIRFNGIIIQNEKIKGFRKCDLKFGSAVNDIMDKKIASFFPTENVTGAVEFPEYSDESDSPHNAGQDWVNLASQMQGKTYPEVKWQLPQMSWKGKFGSDLKQEDTHYKYLGFINYFQLGELLVNRPASLTSFNEVPYNANVIAPQVFILSPLYYAFRELGYVLTGNFVKDPFFRRLMLWSENDNMTKVLQKYPGVVIDIASAPWEEVMAWNFLGIEAPTYAKRVMLTAEEGEYKVRYRIEMSFDLSESYMKGEYGVDVFLNGTRVGSFSSTSLEVQEGELPVSISAEQVGQQVEIRYHSFGREMPYDYLIEYAEDLPDLEFHDQHPTIDFSRYIPDWSVVEYLNNFGNAFNLRIEIDDVAKEVQIDFNENDYLIDGDVVVIRKSLEITSFKNIPAESYQVKYANDSDRWSFIAIDLAQRKDENTEVLENKFKYIPHTTGPATLSDAVAEKEGVGLMLAAVGSVYTSDNFQGRTLLIPGKGGIFETYWKRWLLFRLNAGDGVLKGPFTQTELYQISQKKKIYIDNQLWMVKAINYKENSISLFETEIEGESVTF